MRLLLILVFTIFCVLCSQGQNKTKSSKIDSIQNLINASKDNTKTLEERLSIAIDAHNLSVKFAIDSMTVWCNRNLSSLYPAVGDYESFKKTNYENLELAARQKDTLVLGLANSNLGLYYFYYSDKQNDSAYYFYTQAFKYFNLLNDVNNGAYSLNNLGNIQLSEKDYVGSEENTIQALRLTEKLPETEVTLDRQWILNNRLGMISLRLKQYDQSLEYHEKALEISNKMQNGNYNKLTSINNQAFVYRNLGNPKKALELYQDILDNNDLFTIDPSFYATVIDNIALTKLEAKETDYDIMEKMFTEAYKISDSIEDDIRKLEVSIDLAKFYKHLNKYDLALNYAKDSYDLAKATSSNDLLLESMLLLSELNPGEEGKKYLNEHIKLSDSLLFKERSARNKFARIAFETDEIERENERITRERMWLMILSGGLILTGFLLYIIIAQRSRNKALKFKQSQQEANEEIYNLMLSQQDKVDEARANEKKRISQELHDGILGRLFGTRLSLDSLNFSEGKEAINKRSNYISDLKTIEEDIRKISHDLNTDFVSGSNFMDIITELIENQTKAYQLKYEFDHDDDIFWEEISNKTKINIYRIIQESLQNIYKHADAKAVKISFKLKNDVICLSVSDDGKGFDVNKSRKGIGLKNINSRTNELEGKINFDSKVNKGTTITIDIPYQSN